MNALAWLGRSLVDVIGTSWRVREDGADHPRSLRDDERPFIFALWHAQLLPLLWHHRGDRTFLVISQHRDGQRLAKSARGWGYQTILGSSTRGGTTALRQMIRVLRDGGEVAVTPDGPTGPPRVVKPGVILAAQRTSVPIVPVVAIVSRSWKARSWDRFEIPYPFCRIIIRYGNPVWIPSSQTTEQGCRQLEQRMTALIAQR